MTNASARSLAIAIGLVSTVSTITIAQAQGVVGNIGPNDSLFVDGKSFNVVTGKSKGDTAIGVRRWGAKELGPGALIFRAEDKLYIVDAPTRIPAYVSELDTDRQRGLRDNTYDRRPLARDMREPSPTDAEIERQRPQGLRDPNYDRRSSALDMREQSPTAADIERQRPQGLRDPNYDRQRSAARDMSEQFPTAADIERQRPQGLRDPYYDRQRSSSRDVREQFPTAADIERQRPQGLRDPYYDRRSAADIRQQFPTDADIERQRPRGLRDADSDRLRAGGTNVLDGYPIFVEDPDYAYYKLKKLFEDNWSTNLPK